MKTRSFRADRLDIPAFTQNGASLEGEFTLTDLPRLLEGAHPDALPEARSMPITWRTHGEVRTPRGGAAQAWLHLRVDAVVPLTCQRCLKQVDETLTVDSWFRFVPDEATAAELDAEAEEDVLVSSRAFHLQELIEDELLLALPLAPTHDVCPDARPASEFAAPEDTPPNELPHPFAALASLKTSRRS